MKKSFQFFLYFSVMAVLFACSKSDKPRKKMGGDYSFYHYEVDYYSPDGLTLDSAKEWNFDGTISLNNDNSPGSDWYNNCEYSLPDVPKGWFENSITTKTPFWNIDQGTGKVINFFVEPNPGYVLYATYTITKQSRKKYIFSYVGNYPSGTIKFEERLYLEKK